MYGVCVCPLCICLIKLCNTRVTHMRLCPFLSYFAFLNLEFIWLSFLNDSILLFTHFPLYFVLHILTELHCVCEYAFFVRVLQQCDKKYDARAFRTHTNIWTYKSRATDKFKWNFGNLKTHRIQNMSTALNTTMPHFAFECNFLSIFVSFFLRK